jgi:hypothetical protein
MTRLLLSSLRHHLTVAAIAGIFLVDGVTNMFLFRCPSCPAPKWTMMEMCSLPSVRPRRLMKLLPFACLMV